VEITSIFRRNKFQFTGKNRQFWQS